MAKGHRSQIKKERNIATQEKRPHATAKYVGIPAPKAKIVLDQIKGKDVATAAAMLNYSPRLAAEISFSFRFCKLCPVLWALLSSW